MVYDIPTSEIYINKFDRVPMEKDKHSCIHHSNQELSKPILLYLVSHTVPRKLLDLILSVLLQVMLDIARNQKWSYRTGDKIYKLERRQFQKLNYLFEGRKATIHGNDKRLR